MQRVAAMAWVDLWVDTVKGPKELAWIVLECDVIEE